MVARSAGVQAPVRCAAATVTAGADAFSCAGVNWTA